MKVEDVIGEKVVFAHKRYTRSGTGGMESFRGRVREQAISPGYVVIEGDAGGIYNRHISEVRVII